MRTAEYPAPERILLHLSDTHLRAPATPHLFDAIDGTARLTESSGIRPDAIVVTGDLADLGEPGAYAALRALVDPFAERIGTRVLWVMGNHDERGAFRAGLYDEASDARPVDRVDELDGLRVI